MKMFLMLACLLVGCGPTVTSMDGGIYRIKGCRGIECSRMMNQVCSTGYQILNPDFVEERGALISCYKD